nr:hydrogenase 2 small subunit [Thiobacillaceae bacterium]
IMFGDAGAGTWPVACGHPCIGCTEQGVGFAKPIHALAELKSVAPPLGYPNVAEPRGNGVGVAAAATVGVVVGAVAGATWAINKNLGQNLDVDKSEPGQGGKP